MTDDHQSESQPQEPSSSDSSDGFSADDLDGALDDAAAMADGLSTEVGAPEPTAVSPREDLQSASSTDGDADRDIDADLNEIDRLLGTAEGEVGSAANPADDVAPSGPGESPGVVGNMGAPSGIGADLSDGKSQPDSAAESAFESVQEGDAVPSFMSEFTSAPEEATGNDQPADATPDGATGAAPAVGIVGTGIVGPATLGAEEASEANDEEADGAEAAGIKGRLVALVSRLEEPGQAIAEHGVNLLEKMDKRLERVGPTVRQYVGWAALATLGTALIVYVVSLF